MAEMLEQLSGVVERVVFRNEDNGYTVLDLASDEELHKVVGTFPAIGPGEQLQMLGRWVEHPTFGMQFQAEQYERQLPTDTTDILRYLSSGVIKGVGPATALKIVKKFGKDILTVLEQTPERLSEVSGISPSKAKAIGEEFAAQFGLREIILAFSPYGLTPQEAIRCWKVWKSAAVHKIRNNPYLLCSAGLYIGFEKADRIALAMQIPPDDPRRIEAGLFYVLRHNTANGHTCLPAHKLIPVAANLLQVDGDLVAQVLDNMAGRFAVYAEEIQGEVRIFLPLYYHAERFIAARIAAMSTIPHFSHHHPDQMIDRMEKQDGIRYQEKQRQAITLAVERGALILTGGPGTGKTTTLKAIIRILEHMGQKVAVAAPTGRAAKRISELTGCEAKTLHRLLEVRWSEEDIPVFDRNEQNPLEVDALIIDEMSMVDTLLFESVLRALSPGCRLILVGDSDQLPAVGPGAVLQDLIASDLLPLVQLTEIFRQAEQSRIVTNAHRIVKGIPPEIGHKDGDFFFIPQRSSQEVAETVLDLCQRRLPATYGNSVFNGIQVLCPGKKGVIGTVELNRLLQQHLNPPEKGKREIMVEGQIFREGDKVMHTKNNYEIGWIRDNQESGMGIFNGDIGILEQVDPRGETLSVRYEDRVALYTKEDARDLELAYAITVHKSQGSEFDTVILPLFHQPPLLCYRNLLYTAVTRAKSLMIIVGSKDTLLQMVANDRKALRYSGLRHFLAAASQAPAFP